MLYLLDEKPARYNFRVRISELLIENLGPITKISLTFGQRDKLQPIIIVGANGTGKSILLSVVADAMIEIAKKHFNSVTTTVGISNAYFRSSGVNNSQLGKQYNLAVIKFEDVNGDIVYIDKNGEIPIHIVDPSNESAQRFGNVFSTSEKSVTGAGAGDENVRNLFSSNVLCYFPPSRHEKPFWITEYEHKDITFYGMKRAAKEMESSIILESTWATNRAWISSVYLDSLSDVHIATSGQVEFRINEPIRYMELQKNRSNLEKIISSIMQIENVTLYATFRNIAESRKLALLVNGALLLPSVDNLSTGQIILLNIFTSILRLAEADDLSRTRELDQITGIVVIDEVDAHMHSDIQYNVLPALINLFPQVQFILSTHSPLFVLGMERLFGHENIKIIDMSLETEITSERFSEFRASYDYFKATVTYDEEIRAKINNIQKPIIFVEGETDVMYIKKALEVFGRTDILSQIGIEKVGITINGKENNGGESGLDNLKTFISSNPTFLLRKTMLLYDCDTSKISEDIGSLSIRKISKTEKIPNKRGIENLLPSEYFSIKGSEFATRFHQDRSEFWMPKERENEYGEVSTHESFHKMRFAEWFVNSQATTETMGDFIELISQISQFLEIAEHKVNSEDTDTN